MESEGSLSYLQKPAIDLYFEPDESTLRFPQNPFNYFPIYAKVFRVASPFRFSVSHPSVRATCPAHVILLNLITLLMFSEAYKL